MSVDGLLAVSLVAFGAPLAVNLVRRLRIPSVVAEIIAGIAIGPSGLGWVRVDPAISVISTIGLAMLLFLAGLEVDVSRLRGRLLGVVASGMALSLLLALLTGAGLAAVGLVQAPLLVAVALSATGLGLVVPVLKDAGEVATPFGQVVIAGATVAEFTGIILLSLLFSHDATSAQARLVLLITFGVLAVTLGLGLLRAGESMRVERVFSRLQDTTAQIRVRFAVALLIAFAALAGRFGLEAILGAFVAGAMLRLVDRDAEMVHPLTATKLDAIGFGLLIPVFFVASGLRFDLHALLGSASAIVRVPLFLAALLLVRGVPAILYRPLIGASAVLPAALFQATSLSFIVAATQIGQEMGLVRPATAAALVAAGLLSVVLFPPIGLTLLTRRGARPSAADPRVRAVRSG